MSEPADPPAQGEPADPPAPDGGTGGGVTEWALTDELRLEPVHFIARTDAVMRLGALMLGAGASSAR